MNTDHTTDRPDAPGTTLSKAQLTSMRTSLLDEQASAETQIMELTRNFDEIVTAVEDTNNDDEHDPEGTTIAFERAQVAALLNQAKADLEAVNEAIVRLDDGAFGQCEVCEAPIALERLKAIPSATKCIDCA